VSEAAVGVAVRPQRAERRLDGSAVQQRRQPVAIQQPSVGEHELLGSIDVDGHVLDPTRALAEIAGGVTLTDEMELVTKLSPLPVHDTVTRITEMAAAKGAKVFAVIDHSGEAAAAGLELRDTKVVIFGSPQAGTPVMQAAPLAALDLPLKILVWADGGQTKLTYAPPGELAVRYDLDDELAGRLAAVEAITDAVTAG